MKPHTYKILYPCFVESGATWLPDALWKLLHLSCSTKWEVGDILREVEST